MKLLVICTLSASLLSIAKDADDALSLRFSGLLDPINEEEVEMLGGIDITDVGQDLF